MYRERSRQSRRQRCDGSPVARGAHQATAAHAAQHPYPDPLSNASSEEALYIGGVELYVSLNHAVWCAWVCFEGLLEVTVRSSNVIVCVTRCA
jgi:hypothetical protein